MRRILYAMQEIRKGQLADSGATPQRIQESADMFGWLDRNMSGIRSDHAEKLVETMTSGDFTYAIQEFVSRLALPGYEKMPFPFEPLVWNDTMTNFLPHARYQNRGSLDDLEYVGEKGPPRPGSIDDATKREYSAYRWAKEYDFSYEALVNDDLGYFEDTAMKMGESARRTLEKYVSRFYSNAVSILRLTNLGALYSQNGRLTSARISEARMAFGQRTDARTEPINAELAFIVYHRGLEDVVRTIQASQLVPELATNAANVVRTGWIGIKDPYLTGTAPNLPWYGFTNWQMNNIRPFVLSRLQGWPGPRIFRKRSNIEAVTSILGAGAVVDPILGDFESGNIVLKVEDIFGTYIDETEGNYFDYRGGYYSTGTAP